MGTNYSKHFSTKRTPQSEPIPGSSQVKNNAGGYAWKLDKWKQLDRFLILGAEGGTYYVSERKLTIDNAKSVLECLSEDGTRVVDRIVEISDQGRAYKNDPALFLLAIAASKGTRSVRVHALSVLPKVARTSTHLFHFLEYCKAFRGWGRGLRDAVCKWYQDKQPDQLAYQVVKYRQRDGWTHRDALRLAHPKPMSPEQQMIFRWVVSGETIGDAPTNRLIRDFEEVQRAQTVREVIRLISEQPSLTREMIPTQFLSNPSVWEALLAKMPMTAMVRNLGNMSKVGLLTPTNWTAIDTVCSRLSDRNLLKKARIHPIGILSALRVYASGQGARGGGCWVPVPQVVDALDSAFYLTFDNVVPVNKHVVLALDVSGSMSCGYVNGVVGLTPRDASAAMALVTARTEPRYSFVAFSHNLVPISISPGQRLDDVVNMMARIEFGATDCALPMIWAEKNKVPDIEAFIVYTDSETWHGAIHPTQALQDYRNKFNPTAKLIVVGMQANSFSIADPNDPGMLDIVGFDTASPNLIADFARGDL